MPEVFVSYSHENEDWVGALRLRDRADSTEDAVIWIDGNAIHAGEDWTSKVASAVNGATSAILLISRHFLKSEAITKEELPKINERYREGQLGLVLVPIGNVDTRKAGKTLGIEELDNIVSIPAWSEPLPEHPEAQRTYQEVRERILAAATEPIEIQNLRQNKADKYRLREKLGIGPLGCVVKAHDQELERDIAIKLLREPGHEDLFKKSVRSVAAVPDHSSILSIYGAYLSVEPPHYVRQYVEGESLREMLDRRQEPLDVEHVQQLLSAIGAAVSHSHRHGVYSLNIKPSNIIIQNPDAPPDTEYFLTLNSYEKELLEGQEVFRALGSDIVYLPLEYRRKAGIRAIDAKQADQYRLGLVAYEMLVGARRFAELSKPLKKKSFDVTNWSWPSVQEERPECLEYVGTTVDRMIRIEPIERFDNVGEAVKRFEGRYLEIELVRDSYRRLMKTDRSQNDFFHAFYFQFLDRFKNTKKFFEKYGPLSEDAPPSEAWQRQFQVLKEAVLLLVVFKTLDEEDRNPNILTRIAEHHARKGIPGDLYEPFKEVLLDTVIEKDRERDLSDTELRHAWDEVISPGIDYMRNFSRQE